MTVRLAVVGAGIMGSDHARIFAEEIPGASVEVVCDAFEPRARALADRVGARDVMTDPLLAINRTDVDAIVVASPDTTHASLSLACIAAGKPVLCEKPLSPSPHECLSVMVAEERAGRRLVQLGFMRRFDQSYAEMKATLDGGKLGRALMMHNFHRNVETPNSDFTGAMAITNSAPHEFDVARFVLSSEFAAISAFQPKRSDALVAPVVMVLETINGQLVTIEVNNNAAYGYDVRGELIGETGSVSMSTPRHSRMDARLAQMNTYDEDWRGRYAEAYRRQNKAFLKFVQTGVFPAIAADVWDGYAAAKIAAAGVRALAEGQRIELKPETRSTFYRRA
ncbi:MAG: Gfo/Idh/MocA family oxidoreductase [Rhizobiaceae bacterium]